MILQPILHEYCFLKFYKMTKKSLFETVIGYFSETMPVAETELKYDSPYGLIVAVILSAQCTDKRVNQITPALLKRFPTPQAMAEASVEDVFEYIKSCSYPNNKARIPASAYNLFLDIMRKCRIFRSKNIAKRYSICFLSQVYLIL